MTDYLHRILLIVPVAKVAAVVAWLQANVDPTCPANLGPGLNASGLAADPVTYRWQCACWNDLQCRQILTKICQLATTTPPTINTWNSWTGPQKRTWLLSVRAAILTGYGALVNLAANDGNWDDFKAILAAAGLKQIGL